MTEWDEYIKSNTPGAVAVRKAMESQARQLRRVRICIYLTAAATLALTAAMFYQM